MLEAYIQRTATQLIERAIALKGEIPRPPQPEFQRLASQCCMKIDDTIGELRKLRDDPDLKDAETEAVRLLEFRRLAAQIDRVENGPIAAMARGTLHDVSVNQLLYQMTREIIYRSSFQPSA